jgi:GH15 family glucan-1,4-alpha-glucosidase
MLDGIINFIPQSDHPQNMKKFLLSVFILTSLFFHVVFSQGSSKQLAQSYFKLTTSNGLIVAVYNTSENRIDYAYPHIFAQYDSGKYVHPFIGNVLLKSRELPKNTIYLENTHVIQSAFRDFTISYFASFLRHDKVFYIVARGDRQVLEDLSFTAETGEGNAVSGITLLENPLEDLPVKISGKTLSGTYLSHYKGDVYEKYFLYSFTDALHTDEAIIDKAIASLKNDDVSLLDAEVNYMKNVFSSCIIPSGISMKERNAVEQSVSILKMAQVSDYEIFPFSHGQVLASLRPGLWHIAWVRDGSYAIQAMTRLGMYTEARKALEFMLKAPSGQYKHYIYKDGKDYGVGVDYQVSLTRYFGNGREESDYNEFGPNIEFDDFGLFLIAYCDYVNRSKDSAFYLQWNKLVTTKVANATIHIIDNNSLIREDSGPWEHHLEMPRQYTFTSGVCARGLEMFAQLQKQYRLPSTVYEAGAMKLKRGILTRMLCENTHFKGNVNNQLKSDKEYFDAGTFEIFTNGLMNDKKLFLSHMKEYDKVLRIQGERPGYIRLQGTDPYENQEWVFIDLRIASAYLRFGEKEEAAKLLNYITEQASVNNNTIPEMISNKLQMDKVAPQNMTWNIWCNCIRDKDDQYIGTIPMVGYGSGAYILALYDYYGLN